MVTNQILQNIDLPSPNPLQPEPAKKITISPKYILTIVIFVLAIFLIILSLILGKKTLNNKTVQTQKPISTITPTSILNQNVGATNSEIVQTLNQINIYLNDNRRFLPPDINPNLGFVK